jgi:O-antigen biosynthesis protein
MSRFMDGMKFPFRMAWAFLTRPRQVLAKIRTSYRKGGLRGCWALARRKLTGRESVSKPFGELSPAQAATLLASCPDQPLVSIVVPVYNVAPRWLEKCLASVARQSYSHWELLLVDDGSEGPELAALMAAWAARDPRIRVQRIEKNAGIAAASNAGIERASGRYIGFLDHDDELSSDALTWVIWTLNRRRDALWLYSDEDKMAVSGQRHLPHFKSDYNPYLLLCAMYTCHFSVYEASVLRQVGGFREGFEGSQDHDLALRLSEAIPRERVVRIPRVLYHWRQLPTSTASGIQAKPHAADAGRKAVEQALARRRVAGRVSSHPCCPTLYRVELLPRSHPRVCVIIPTRNERERLLACIEALRKHTRYPNYEILVIDSLSDDARLLAWLSAESSAGRLRVMRYDKPFNHSEMNNLAVQSVETEFVVLMNNDVEVTSDGWLEQLVATVQLDERSAGVGALLLYPNGTVQHAGVILGLGGLVGHAHRGVDKNEGGYCGRLSSLQEFSAVTAALVLLRRSAFLEVGGFRADRYPTSFNDVDLWLRLRRQGYLCLYNPLVQAVHAEAASRGADPEHETAVCRLAADWQDVIDNDPFYNPNLARDNEVFSGCRTFSLEEHLRLFSLSSGEGGRQGGGRPVSPRP